MPDRPSVYRALEGDVKSLLFNLADLGLKAASAIFFKDATDGKSIVTSASSSMDQTVVMLPVGGFVAVVGSM